MIKRALLSLAAATGLLIGALAGVAHAANLINTTTPFTITTTACNGETVVLTGTIHEIGDRTDTPSGGVLVSAHVDISASGIGAVTGTNYRLNAHTSGAVSFTPGGAQNATIPASAVLISQGSIANQDAQTVMHETINPDGTITAAVDKVTASCRG